jgi:hypothetical protein
MQINKYIGDEAFEKMLAHYQCPTPLYVIKMKFAGALCSPNLELRPTDVISSFWEQGKEPRLETKDEAELFFKFFMGLWDEIFTQVKENKIRLDIIKWHNADELKTLLSRRYAEVELGYVEGLWGGRDDLKIPTYLAELIDNLTDLASVYNTLSTKLDKGSKIEDISHTLEYTDKMVNKAISFIIENSVLPRIETLTRVVH